MRPCAVRALDTRRFSEACTLCYARDSAGAFEIASQGGGSPAGGTQVHVVGHETCLPEAHSAMCSQPSRGLCFVPSTPCGQGATDCGGARSWSKLANGQHAATTTGTSSPSAKSARFARVDVPSEYYFLPSLTSESTSRRPAKNHSRTSRRAKAADHGAAVAILSSCHGSDPGLKLTRVAGRPSFPK